MSSSRRAATIRGSMVLLGLFSGCSAEIPDADDSGTTALHEEARRPNIVFVLTDQWRAQATGYSGDPNLLDKTPNLDRIAILGI